MFDKMTSPLHLRSDNWKPAIALYNPNGGASMTGFAAFGILTAIAWTRYFRSRPRPKWMLLLVLGCTFMSLGFLCRFSRRNHIGAWAFLGETLCILLSPCAFLAQDYVLIPRISMHLDTDDCLLIRRRWLVKLYVFADLITFAAQVGGTALLASTQTLAKIGKKIITGGLWVQAAVFLSFVSIYIGYGRRLRSRPSHTAKWAGDDAYIVGSQWRHNWKSLYRMIGVSCVLVTIRSIFRIVEFTSGSESAVATKEVFLYLFDILPMFVNVTLFLFVWPPHCLETTTLKDPALAMSSPASS